LATKHNGKGLAWKKCLFSSRGIYAQGTKNEVFQFLSEKLFLPEDWKCSWKMFKVLEPVQIRSAKGELV